MKTITKNKSYEGMFLIDTAVASSDWDGVNTAIDGILKKAQAEVSLKKKWDERKLAYPVKGKDRGTYILTYFQCPGESIATIERDVQLSEKIMRVLILTAEHITDDDKNKDTPIEAIETAQAKAAADAEARVKEAEEKANAAEAEKAAEATEVDAETEKPAEAAIEKPAEDTTEKPAEAAEKAPAEDAPVEPAPVEEKDETKED